MILVDSYPIDVLLSGSESMTASVTAFPVESRSTKSDHIVKDARRLDIEGFVSNTPIGAIAQHETRRVDEVTRAVFGDQIPLPSNEAYELLERIWKESKVVTVEVPVASPTRVPGKRTHRDMALTSFVPMLGKESDGGMRFTASFTKIEEVENARSIVEVASIPAGRGSKKKTATARVRKVVNVVRWNYSWAGPGASWYPGMPYCFVEIDKGPSNEVDDDIYTYQSHGSSLAGGNGPPFPFPLHNNGLPRVLEGGERARFIKDYNRDLKAKYNAQERAKNPDHYDAQLAVEQVRRQHGLPPGMDNSRFVTGGPEAQPKRRDGTPEEIRQGLRDRHTIAEAGKNGAR